MAAKLPSVTDNSPQAQAFRKAAVDSCNCPRCGATTGFACKAANGGNYDPRYTVHRARLEIHAEGA